MPPATGRSSASWSMASSFDADRVDQRVTLGAVEEWTIVNEHQDDHVFHIHVNPFQVIKVNGEPVRAVLAGHGRSCRGTAA